MSTNRKNVIRKAPLSNFTTNLNHRSIVVDRMNYSLFCLKISSIMEEVNKTIQEVDLNIEDRRMPFVVGFPITRDTAEMDDSRIIFSPTENAFGTSFSKKDRKNTSHLIEFQLSAIYNQLTFSNSFCEAKLVIDENYLLPAMTDLFLDLSMFNSYSFLRNMSISEKRDFSKQKFDYFKKKSLPCYYTYDDSDTLLYYSLAFSARLMPKKIDIQKYIALWDDFLQTYYSGSVHYEPSLELQLRQHVDFGQLPYQKILDELNQLPTGGYLLIRLNKHPRSSKLIAELNALLSGGTPTPRTWKILPLSKYPTIRKYAQTLYISVYKIVKA